jgi:hypothetical protein
LLAILVVPLIVGIFVGFCVPVTPCPGCAGNRPGVGFVPPHMAYQSAGLMKGTTVAEPQGVTIQV